MSHSYDCRPQLSDGSGSLTGFARGSVRRNIDFNSAANEGIAACCHLAFIAAGSSERGEHRDQPANAASFIAPKFRRNFYYFREQASSSHVGKYHTPRKRWDCVPRGNLLHFFKSKIPDIEAGLASADRRCT